MMGRNLLVVLLVAVILALMIPVTTRYCNSEQAFTSDNLIRIDIVSK